ncbi:MAG: antibiotic biosynthesis monooxygenase family protein [Pseudomonadota bacterium]|nr:antibiotic biosynthesis monooxygenase family protein [Pseudomonadota bacterium]
MPVARHFIMHAAAGQGPALEAALRDLADTLRRIPGCEAVQLLREQGQPLRFVFIETWASVAAHQQASQHLSAEALAPMMAALDGMPEGNEAYFDCLKAV